MNCTEKRIVCALWSVDYTGFANRIWEHYKDLTMIETSEETGEILLKEKEGLSAMVLRRVDSDKENPLRGVITYNEFSGHLQLCLGKICVRIKIDIPNVGELLSLPYATDKDDDFVRLARIKIVDKTQ